MADNDREALEAVIHESLHGPDCVDPDCIVDAFTGSELAMRILARWRLVPVNDGAHGQD